MRSHGLYYEHGEKSGRLLARQLKSKSAAQIISRKTFEAPILSSNHSEYLGLLELGEVSSAISAMRNGKSPGPDGFPIDFYKKFLDQLTPLLLDMFIDALSQGKLPHSVTLLLKPGRELQNVDHTDQYHF